MNTEKTNTPRVVDAIEALEHIRKAKMHDVNVCAAGENHYVYGIFRYHDGDLILAHHVLFNTPEDAQNCLQGLADRLKDDMFSVKFINEDRFECTDKKNTTFEYAVRSIEVKDTYAVFLNVPVMVCLHAKSRSAAEEDAAEHLKNKLFELNVPRQLATSGISFDWMNVTVKPNKETP